MKRIFLVSFLAENGNRIDIKNGRSWKSVCLGFLCIKICLCNGFLYTINMEIRNTYQLKLDKVIHHSLNRYFNNLNLKREKWNNNMNYENLTGMDIEKTSFDRTLLIEFNEACLKIVDCIIEQLYWLWKVDF
jgi:hypothetical protein